MDFKFGEYKTRVCISREIPSLEEIAAAVNWREENGSFKPLVICDENTFVIADAVCGGSVAPRCVLKSGEENKNWNAVEKILSAACENGFGRDGIFIGIGGGVIGDLAGFAASIYMRGCRFVLVSTTLLGMVDASVGGKTGFDLFGIKNLIGSFYPAEVVFLPVNSLSSLPPEELKSGMAELIKTAVLSGDDFLDELAEMPSLGFCDFSKLPEYEKLPDFIERAVLYKGGIVSEDLRESGKRALLNLGHTFGHALEAAAGLGKLSHGEAVAWGIARACELGLSLGITPKARALKIRELLSSFGYFTGCPHPLAQRSELIIDAMKNDKKKKNRELTFIVPDEKSARPAALESEDENKIIKKIINGELSL